MGSKNLEIEIKIKIDCNKIETIENNLKKFNAKFSGEREELDLYLNHPCKDMKENDEAIRIRYVNGKPETITYKSKRGDKNNPIKSREEIIVETKEDPMPLFSKLGFSVGVKVKKKRRYYDLDNLEFSLDFVDNLGCFIEIESKNAKEEDIIEALNKFNIKGEIITKTYADMVSEIESFHNKS
ncbi:class IV adenylate cyclase [Caldisphaera lagunensis]|uniref:class IV adenylate cyclase n=1 Tax=Caldisphaera lagunensis TaxID=200415 RepID=UPI0006620ED9|nr:class IV adenylate cyclase [Caldisphaera lagunensis]